MDGSLKASTQNRERLGKEGEDAGAGEVRGWGAPGNAAWGGTEVHGTTGGVKKRVMKGRQSRILYFLIFQLPGGSPAAGLTQEGGAGVRWAG